MYVVAYNFDINNYDYSGTETIDSVFPSIFAKVEYAEIFIEFCKQEFIHRNNFRIYKLEEIGE